MTVPSPDDVRRIAAMTDRVTRNREITSAYRDFSIAIAARTGACANWCTFAHYASEQAGRTIRGEDWIDILEHNTLTGSVFAHPIRSTWRILLRHGLLNPDTFLGRIVHNVHTPFDALERASEAVTRGNLKVFDEIGYYFAQWLHTGKADFRDEKLLRSAFSLYERQATEPDPVLRSQMSFMANVQIGLHEQTRLQPEIKEALESLPSTFPLTFDRPARELVRRMITRSLMTLVLPTTTLQLGRHIDRPPAPTLTDIRDPELQAILARFEPCANHPDDCGADDWADLDQRMHFIVHVFRCFHETKELHQ